MAATAPFTHDAVLTALRNDDEEALERLFHERFATMMQSATASLAEPARAARAVERAFLELIAADGAIADASPTVVAEAVGWVDGEIVIAGRPLGEALPILRRWYGLTLTVDEKTLLERPLTMRASVDSMRAAIRELQRGANVIVDYDGKKNRVWDAARRQP